MRILIWYRNDLRLHDHQPLHRALEAHSQVIPVYCFDPRQFGQTAFGFAKTGAYRAEFLRQSVADLRQAWRDRGSNLLIRRGQPEDVIPELVQRLDIDAVYGSEEITAEEKAIDQALIDQFKALQVSYQTYWGATLYHPNQLPFEIADLPDVFTQFRQAVEKSSQVSETLPTPERLPALPEEIDPGELPALEDLGLEPKPIDPRAVLPYQGGESQGFERLQHYFWQADQLKFYKETRNEMLGADYSSKFSAWLALGCLSPRYIYEQVQAYEANRVSNKSTYWLVFELLWRDFFRFVCAKFGDRVFYKSGIRGLDIDWKQDWERFEKWQQGKTGFPLVDANMREIAATGYMSNRGRQNVASFLTKNLGIDWRMGAEWFESLLIDYDVCSNWGNWNYVAGVGNDARGFRYFNIPKQSKDYDPEGEYVKHWLPELKPVPASKVHKPWQLSSEEQKRYDVRLGVNYPNPVVDLEKSFKENEKVYTAAQERAA